ncbi:MAG: glycerophosphodiester phosphodiesterase [Planctomycetota bacterium]
MARVHPENTIAAFRAAIEAGADAVEVDAVLTADDHIVLWHDPDPRGFVARMRRFGLEPGLAYRPAWPGRGSRARRPVHEVALSTVRDQFGYTRRRQPTGRGARSSEPIATLEELARYAADEPRVHRLLIDVKVPDGPEELLQRFAARAMVVLLAYGLADRVVFLHKRASVVERLKAALGDRFRCSHDIEIVSPWPRVSSYSAVAAAKSLGTRTASLGRPRVGFRAFRTYLEILRADRRTIDAAASPHDLITWTINREHEMRTIIDIGVDGMITDDPALLARVLSERG